MKKLLVIVVLGLLMGCASSPQSGDSNIKGVEIDARDYQEFQKQAIDYYKGHIPFFAEACSENLMSNCLFAASVMGQSDANNIALQNCRRAYNNCVVVREGNTNVYEEKIKETEKIKLSSMIGDAKNTCKDLGFTEGTDKFADCSLKLYTQSVELAAKNNQTVVMQPQSSGSNVMTIYDPRRDSRILINQGQRMLSGACTLGINC